MPFTPPKFSEETFQAFALYFEATGGKWDKTALERVTGLTYKNLWSKLDKAKKAMKAEGWEPATLADGGAEGAGASATPKKKSPSKRKAKAVDEDANEDDAEDVSPTKKVKNEVDGVKEEEEDD